MKRTLITGMLSLVIAGLVAALGLVAPANASKVGNEGCTPGYWKNHTSNWQEVKPTRLLTWDHRSVKIIAFAPSTDDLNHDGLPDTYLDALSFQGGSDLEGAEQILLRASVAAYLNAAHEGLGYPLRRQQFIAEVNAAIASGDRQTMIDLATTLDNLNNLGCPL